MSQPSVCNICCKYSSDLRIIGENRASCSICRSLDRIRGICLRLPTSSVVSTQSLLYETEARLRDLRHFQGALAVGESLRVEPPGPETLSGILKDTEPGVSQGSSRGSGGSAPSHSVPDTSATDMGTASSSVGQGGKAKKRHKKNRGVKRKEWQHFRVGVSAGRHEASGVDDLDWSSESADPE